MILFIQVFLFLYQQQMHSCNYPVLPDCRITSHIWLFLSNLGRRKWPSVGGYDLDSFQAGSERFWKGDFVSGAKSHFKSCVHSVVLVMNLIWELFCQQVTGLSEQFIRNIFHLMLSVTVYHISYNLSTVHLYNNNNNNLQNQLDGFSKNNSLCKYRRERWEEDGR